MIDLGIVKVISKEAKYRPLKVEDKNFVSYIKYYSKGRIRINIYFNIDVLILCITGKIKHPTFRRFENIQYSDMDEIFKYPNRFKR